MTETKLKPIPRPARPQADPPAVDEWVGLKPPVPSAARTDLIKAAVTPELKRRLRLAAAAEGTTVADALRALAEQWAAEKGF